jgi:ribonuclease D
MEEALSSALSLSESEWPQVIRGVRIRSTKEQVDRFNKLRDHRDKVALEIDLDPSILAPKAALEAVAADAKAPVLMPWQRELLGLEPLPEVLEAEPESAEAA